jgi:hypothetical protein
MNDGEFGAGFSLACILLGGIFTFTLWLQHSSWQRACVKHGVAEYVADKDGDSEWRWVQPEIEMCEAPE